MVVVVVCENIVLYGTIEFLIFNLFDAASSIQKLTFCGSLKTENKDFDSYHLNQIRSQVTWLTNQSFGV